GCGAAGRRGIVRRPFRPGARLPVAKRAERSEEQGPRLSVLCQVPSVVLWVIGVTFLFNFLYGPVDVGMPLLARLTLAAGPMLYGELFVVFGVGSLIGGLAGGG